MTPSLGARYFVRLIAILTVIVTGGWSTTASANERRVAFVVGNSNYQTVPKLPNPRADAEAVALALRSSGFEVVTALDLDQLGFEIEMERFVRSMSGADVGLFYYAGHAIQVDGDNRIIPTNAKLQSPADMEVETFSLRTVMALMQANSRTQIIYFDACRNNPFPSPTFLVGPDKEVAMTTFGLAAADGTLGSLVAFSTQPGEVAIDGLGSRSPFTNAFLRHSFRVGTDVQTASVKIAEDVWNATQQRQRPWTSNALNEPVFLTLPLVSALTPATPSLATPKPVDSEFGAVANQLRKRFTQAKQVPIGVGAVGLLGDFPVSGSEVTTVIALTQPPQNGVVYLDDKILRTGAVLTESHLPNLKYEPSLGSEGETDTIELSISDSRGSSKITVSGRISPTIDACDNLAAEPFDLQGINAGLPLTEVDVTKAQAACDIAVEDYPRLPRFRYQLGRTLLANGDVEAALAHFQSAAKAGYTRAHFQIGFMTQRGIGTKQDFAAANGFYKLAVEKGDPLALAAYGSNLTRGTGVAKNVGEGVRLLNRAIELGYANALAELGEIYEQKEIVRPNPARAVRMYEAGLDRNNPASMRQIASAYRDGNGVARNRATAVALLKQAARLGDTAAPAGLAKLYFNGVHLRRNTCSAIEWYDLAARRGDVSAAMALGDFFSKGPQAAREIDRAIEYYARAANIKNVDLNLASRTALRNIALADKVKFLRRQQSANLSKAGAVDEQLVELMRLAMQNSGELSRIAAFNYAETVRPRTTNAGDAAGQQLKLWNALQSSTDLGAYVSFLTTQADGIFLLPALDQYLSRGGKLSALPQRVQQAVQTARKRDQEDILPWRRSDGGTCLFDAVSAKPAVNAVKAAPKSAKPFTAVKKKKVSVVKPVRKITNKSKTCKPTFFNAFCGSRESNNESSGGRSPRDSVKQQQEPQTPRNPDTPSDGGTDPSGGDTGGDGSGGTKP